MARDGELAATSGPAESKAEASGIRHVVNTIVAVCWAVNIGLLLAAFAWIYFSGESRDTVELMKRAVLPSKSAAGVILDPSRLGLGIAIGLACIATAIVACVAMLASLFVGRGRFRTTRMWLVFMTVVCAWLGLVVSWPAVYWFGQQRRVAAVVPAAAAMVESLRGNWPQDDSELPDIGPFLAYPTGAPTAILPLRIAMFPQTEMRFSAIERTGDDAMRFELSGAELGAWLEWRRDGNEPRPFVGGLDTKYEPVKVARLRSEWFLVRYLATGLGR